MNEVNYDALKIKFNMEQQNAKNNKVEEQAGGPELPEEFYRLVDDFTNNKIDLDTFKEQAMLFGIREDQLTFIPNNGAIQNFAQSVLDTSSCPKEMQEVILKCVEDRSIDNLDEMVTKYGSLETTEASQKAKAKECSSNFNKLKNLISEGKEKEAEKLAEEIQSEMFELNLGGIGTDPSSPEMLPWLKLLWYIIKPIPCGPTSEGYACMSGCPPKPIK